MAKYFLAMIACVRHLARLVSIWIHVQFLRTCIVAGKIISLDVICSNSFLLYKKNNGILIRVNCSIELHRIECINSMRFKEYSAKIN